MNVFPNGNTTLTETVATHNNGTKATVAANTEDTVAADTKDTVAANTKDAITADAGITPTSVAEPIKATSIVASTLHSLPSQVSLNAIDEASVPAFLLSHGKGKREVNIFHYLRDVKDPHFQQVLFHYLHFEIGDRSKGGGLLPTTNHPVTGGKGWFTESVNCE